MKQAHIWLHVVLYHSPYFSFYNHSANLSYAIYKRQASKPLLFSGWLSTGSRRWLEAEAAAAAAWRFTGSKVNVVHTLAQRHSYNRPMSHLLLQNTSIRLTQQAQQPGNLFLRNFEYLVNLFHRFKTYFMKTGLDLYDRRSYCYNRVCNIFDPRAYYSLVDKHILLTAVKFLKKFFFAVEYFGLHQSPEVSEQLVTCAGCGRVRMTGCRRRRASCSLILHVVRHVLSQFFVWYIC